MVFTKKFREKESIKIQQVTGVTSLFFSKYEFSLLRWHQLLKFWRC